MLDFRGSVNGNQFFGLRTEGWSNRYRSNFNTGENYIYGVNGWDTNRQDINDRSSDFQFFGRKGEAPVRVDTIEIFSGGGLENPIGSKDKITFRPNTDTFLGDTSTTALSPNYKPMGLWIVTNATDSDSAVVLTIGDSTTIVGQNGSGFSTTSGNNDTINIYWSGSQYEIENQTGSTKEMNAAHIGSEV
jgi:hypothetical protein